MTRRPRRPTKTPAEVKAILRDYAKGVPVATIQTKHDIGCSSLYTLVAKYGTRRTKPSKATKWGRCSTCGVSCRSKRGLCQECANSTDFAGDLGLPDGDWVTVGATRIWQPGAKRPTVEPTLSPADVAKLIACPVCRVRLDQMCQTTTGRHRSPHPARLIIKRCPCGEPINSGRKVCDDCRGEARRANARVGMRNTRARRRESEAA